jgi:GGDEF domain-containing protein
MTISIGVAVLVPTEDTSPQDLVQLADRALYRAKEKGRTWRCWPCRRCEKGMNDDDPNRNRRNRPPRRLLPQRLHLLRG